MHVGECLREALITSQSSYGRPTGVAAQHGKVRPESLHPRGRMVQGSLAAPGMKQGGEGGPPHLQTFKTEREEEKDVVQTKDQGRRRDRERMRSLSHRRSDDQNGWPAAIGSCGCYIWREWLRQGEGLEAARVRV